MAESCLLVPMRLDAMVLTERAVTETFLRFQMDYGELSRFASPEPKPFAGEDPRYRKETGVHLHWTLPRALRQGSHQESSGETSFHLIPNRWLIVRMSEGADAGLQAWLVESDYLGDDGSTPYVDPAARDAASANPIKIGRVREWSAVSSAAGGPLFLKAVAPGTVFFSAFAPSTRNVLSFYDALTGVGRGAYTYNVIGWYSDAAADPLKDTKWESDTSTPERYRNDTFDWEVYPGSGNPPSRTVVHAFVHKVTWDRSGDTVQSANYPANIPEKVKVSFGNTAIDALAALCEATKGTEYADLLTAFQYGLLEEFDDPGSAERLNSSIRQQWYGAASGGTLWTIIPAEQPEENSAADPPTPEELAELAKLNDAQSELDRQTRIFESMQERLYSLWWKENYLRAADEDDNVPRPIRRYVDWYLKKLHNQVDDRRACPGTNPDQESWYFCKVRAQGNLLEEKKQAVAERKKKTGDLLPKERLLREVNQPQCFYPNDPVLLVTGLGRSTNFDPARGVTCRVAPQCVNDLVVDGKSSAGIAPPPLDDPKQLLPEGARQLHLESMLLSPGLLAPRIGKTPAQVAAAIEKLPKLVPGGRFPALPYSREAWKQPWIPLLLDWSVTVLKAPAYDATMGHCCPK